ncbi:MAG: hypothetical protein JST39_00155 [Bacteroidetes bacterium]|nr:hypothetical protein [Bacteroidota bacterium]
MPKRPLNILFWLLITGSGFARTYTDAEAQAAWTALKKQSITTQSFHNACDLIQDVGQTNLGMAYDMLAEYLPNVRRTGHREWVHVVLMGWAKAKESLGFFPAADSLYRLARENADWGSRPFDEALVGTVLLYTEWGRPDSLEKYAAIGIESCRAAGDNENRSFICTFFGVSNSTDTAFMRRYLDTAVSLAMPLVDKNALFTALYNKATIYAQFNPQEQASIFNTLLTLSSDSGLRYKPRLWQRTAFYFRNPKPSIYYQLMQVNMLLTDYDNASRFATLFYETAIVPNPKSPQAPYFTAELALVKANQEDFNAAVNWLAQSRELFGMPEDKIPNSAFYLAAGLLAEHDRQNDKALYYFRLAAEKGTTYGRHFMQPAIYYAHALTINGHLDEAGQALAEQRPVANARRYSALGLYYYKYYAEWLKARGNFAAYGAVLDTFYRVRDSLVSINHYRAIQDLNARIQLRDREQQLVLAREANAIEIRNRQKERSYLIVLLVFALITAGLLLAYARNQRLRKKQAEQIAAQQKALQQKELEEMQRRHELDRLESAALAEENERSRIAAELHDEAGTLLSVAKMNLSSALEKELPAGPARDHLEKTGELITSVAGGIRSLSHRLMPPAIEKHGFKKAIENIAETINLPGTIALETVIVGFGNTGKYPPLFLVTIYRIVMELLNNVLRHSKAGAALLELVEHEDAISILVEDNGVGIPGNGNTNGKGLENIHARLAGLKGHMEIMGKEEGGTLIVINIPV